MHIQCIGTPIYICIYLFSTGVPEKIKRGKLQYNPINLTAIRLTWAEPLDSNSPIINYTVSCDKCPTKSITVDTNVTVITGLIPGVEYKLNVAAVNAFGRGPDSVAVTAQSATSGVNHKLYCTMCIKVFP